MMTDEILTAFQNNARLTSGTRAELERTLAPLGPHPEGLLVFSDTTGAQTDLNLTDLNLTDRDVPPPRRGRPKLGVKAREITLLPRHWEWLAGQRGGASAAMRRLVDDAMRAASDEDPRRPDRAYRFLSAIAGDFPGYEAALRALYADDPDAVRTAMEGWPDDIQTHALVLAGFAPHAAQSTA